MAITNLTSTNFQQYINNNKIVVIDFYADWCGPCKMLSPIIESLSLQMPQIMFGKVNIDLENQLAQQFNIMSIPTILIFKNNKIVTQFSGYRSESEIKKIIGEI